MPKLTITSISAFYEKFAGHFSTKMEIQNQEEKLVPLGIEAEGESFLVRVVDSATRLRAVLTISTLAFSEILIILIMFIFTSTVTKEVVRFDSLSPPLPASKTRRFQFNFTGLHFFHEHLSLDLFFENDKTTKSEFNVSTYFVSTMYLGNKVQSRIEVPTKSHPCRFTENEDSSSPIRVFASNLVHYNNLFTDVYFKLSPSSLNLNGSFVWSFSDPAFAIVLVFLRVLFFGIALIIFFKLTISYSDIKYSHAAIRFALVMDFLVIICSNPLYILSYFTASNVFKIVDSVLSLFILFVVIFACFFSLMLDDLVHHEATFAWLSVRLIPFLIGFIIFVANSFYEVGVTLKDPHAISTKVLNGLNLMEVLILIFYLLLVIIRGYRFKSEAPYEKLINLSMALIMITAAAFIELISIQNQTTNKSVFQMLSAAIFSLFYIFINWPVNSIENTANIISENPDENIAINEPLASQME